MIILEYYQSKISHPRMRNEFKLLPSRPSYTQIDPTLPNTNAMPHIKTQAKPQNRKESQGYRQKKKNQIKSKHRTPLFIQPIPLPLSFFLFTPAEPKETTLLGS
jgi:hypothetical protein